jgi:Domain of unknown function (DUF4265)
MADGRYWIANVPFSAFGSNLDDIVEASHEDRVALFHALVAPGGHRTYRMLIWPDVDPGSADTALATLVSLGCGIERATSRWIALDVPPSVPAPDVVQVLDSAWEQCLWRYEDAAVAPGSGTPLSRRSGDIGAR